MMQMGPIRDPQKKANVLRYIEAVLRKAPSSPGRPKANIIEVIRIIVPGPYYLRNVDPKSQIGAEEIFGPVMSIMRVKIWKKPSG